MGWPQPTLVTIAIAPDGPRASWRYADDTLSYLGGTEVDERPTLLVTYKSVDVALPVLLGRTGILAAFAEHRSTLAGDIGHGDDVREEVALHDVQAAHERHAVPILPTRPVREVFFGRVYASLVGSSVQIKESA